MGEAEAISLAKRVLRDNPAALMALADPLPATYIVGSLVSDVPDQHADNGETEQFIRMQLSIYSTGGLLSLPDTDTAMKAAGFKRGPARELPYDQETGHYGMAREYTILFNL